MMSSVFPFGYKECQKRLGKGNCGLHRGRGIEGKVEKKVEEETESKKICQTFFQN